MAPRADAPPRARAGVLNYVIIRPITALIAFISESRGVYGEGELFNATKSYTYVVFVNSWSQTHASASPRARAVRCACLALRAP